MDWLESLKTITVSLLAISVLINTVTLIRMSSLQRQILNHRQAFQSGFQAGVMYSHAQSATPGRAPETRYQPVRIISDHGGPHA